MGNAGVVRLAGVRWPVFISLTVVHGWLTCPAAGSHRGSIFRSKFVRATWYAACWLGAWEARHASRSTLERPLIAPQCGGRPRSIAPRGGTDRA